MSTHVYYMYMSAACYVDLWVLDVEGGELNVLKGVDFARIQISVILLETMHGDPAPLALLRDKGYDCNVVGKGKNNVCTHPSLKASVTPQPLSPLIGKKNNRAYSNSLEVLYD